MWAHSPAVLRRVQIWMGAAPGEPGLGRVLQMWNNSKSPIRYLWGKGSDCHIIEVEPCTGTIGNCGDSGGGAGGRGRSKKTGAGAGVQRAPGAAPAAAWPVWRMRKVSGGQTSGPSRRGGLPPSLPPARFPLSSRAQRGGGF